MILIILSALSLGMCAGICYRLWLLDKAARQDRGAVRTRVRNHDPARAVPWSLVHGQTRPR